MCWIWTIVYDLKDAIYADIEHGTGDITQSDITSTQLIDTGSTPPAVTLDDKVGQNDNIIFVSYRNPLVSKRVVDIIKTHSDADKVAFLKAVFLPDYLVDGDFFFVRPLIEKKCTVLKIHPFVGFTKM